MLRGLYFKVWGWKLTRRHVLTGVRVKGGEMDVRSGAQKQDKRPVVLYLIWKVL